MISTNPATRSSKARADATDPSRYARLLPSRGRRREAPISFPSRSKKRPSTTASSPKGPTRSDRASPPSRSRRAPSRSVFPVPVSPVMTVRPGPGSRRAEEMTPRLRTTSSSIIPSSQPELLRQGVREGAGAEAKELHRVGSAGDDDHVFELCLPERLLVHSHACRPVARHPDLDPRVGRENDGAPEEGMRRNGGEQD